MIPQKYLSLLRIKTDKICKKKNKNTIDYFIRNIFSLNLKLVTFWW